MAESKSLAVFRFEEFPDEILLEIFKYFKAADLSRFIGLNQRLNNIVYDVKLNVVIEYPDDDDDEEEHDFLFKFQAKQFISLNVSYGWEAFEVNRFEELRSLSLNCYTQNERQFENLLNVNLPYLERLSIGDVPNSYAKELFRSIISCEHFPSLKFCHFSGQYYSLIELHPDEQIVNTTIRTLILSYIIKTELDQLFNILSNLHHLETTVIEEQYNPSEIHTYHMSLEHLRLTYGDSYPHLENILLHTPNLKQLCIKGKIEDQSVLIFFEKLARLICSNMLRLQKFHCELYFHAWNRQADILVIQQLHPLFKSIDCLLGQNINQCYTTDLTEYPLYSKYSHVGRVSSYSRDNWNTTHYFDDISRDYDDYFDDRDEYDDNDGWVDYGLGYRGNYKANYGSSPWSGNNSD